MYLTPFCAHIKEKKILKIRKKKCLMTSTMFGVLGFQHVYVFLISVAISVKQLFQLRKTARSWWYRKKTLNSYDIWYEYLDLLTLFLFSQPYLQNAPTPNHCPITEVYIVVSLPPRRERDENIICFSSRFMWPSHRSKCRRWLQFCDDFGRDNLMKSVCLLRTYWKIFFSSGT